jgi:hypothetical protein
LLPAVTALPPAPVLLAGPLPLAATAAAVAAGPPAAVFPDPAGGVPLVAAAAFAAEAGAHVAAAPLPVLLAGGAFPEPPEEVAGLGGVSAALHPGIQYDVSRETKAASNSGIHDDVSREDSLQDLQQV